jgi:hypothetical protein
VRCDRAPGELLEGGRMNEHDRTVFEREATIMLEYFADQPEGFRDPDYDMSREGRQGA